jgi:imidazolonepropionase-like amidohydrolase
MKLRLPLLLALLAFLPAEVFSQTEPAQGLRANTPGIHALTGATVVVAPGNVMNNATVVIRNGVIEAVGANVTPPADAVVTEMNGRTIYPGFIDAYSHIGQRDEPAEEEERGAVNWNPQVRSFIDAAAEYYPDHSLAEELRSQGFTAALSAPELGMFRGSAAVVSLAGESPRQRVVRPGIAQVLGLTRDTSVGSTYPTSAMGGMVFVRQMLSDAEWYRDAHARYAQNPQGLARPETNRALASLEAVVNGEQPLIIEARDEEEFLRAASFADEFGVDLWIRGSGSEYRLLEQVAATGLPVLLPLNFPGAPNVGDNDEDALGVSVGQLLHWRHAPENPGRLDGAGVTFAFTTSGLDDVDDFLPNLRAAVEHGLDRERALAALTTTPAEFLGISGSHGSIEAGKVANLVVTDGDLFSDDTGVVETWVDGARFHVGSSPVLDGGSQLRAAASNGTRTRGISAIEPLPVLLDHDHDHAGDDGHDDGEHDQAGGVEVLNADALNGGETLPILPRPSAQFDELVYPLMDYGRAGLPEQPEHVVVRGATIWTQGPQGMLENADLLVSNGVVAEVGTNLDAPSGAVVIDGEGKHVTPGLIDAHLHSGLSGGVNEGGSAIVPEVRIGDVISANNIWMYRQMAGGLTTAHVMHGSANPIGGQNQIVKMRWGAPPEELKFEDAPRTVKFALGENVTRNPNRYPNTRQGVEQIILDHFKQAEDYVRAWDAWEATGEGLPPRRDYRMEALRDIRSGDITIQSHSYRQDEILMLMRLAEELDMQVKAFHHGVEAYRVAPELAAHGAGAVVWSDWSGFKIEAYNATLYNVRGLLDAGVVTSLHSDNSQIAARMNWEAAKMLRTGVSEEEALSLVTNATAQLLGIDDRVGSLEAGKDGDFVIWSTHPLSAATTAEQTWIDGRKYFDIEEDRQHRAEVEQLRDELIQQIRDGR